MSLSYFNIKKLRRQSKQPEQGDLPSDAVTTELAKDKTTSPAKEPTTSPPAPTITTPGEEPAASPVLDEEDEIFLQRLAAIASEPEGPAPPLPTRPSEAKLIDDNGVKRTGRDAQEALMDGADKVPLPTSPPAVVVEDTDKGKASDEGLGRKKSVMGYFQLAQSKFKRSGGDKEKDESKEKDSKKDKGKNKVTEKDRAKLADDLLAAAENSKLSEDEAAKEREDLTKILDDLNLSAVNNRVFSFSKESEELLNKFKLVLKDLVNGVPTAYNDLEKLFTDYEGQLKKMYGSLPPFLQNLVKSLPTKITAALGPELLAAQSEKPGFDAKAKAAGSGSKKFTRPKVPSLKSLLSAEGAVATMLRSILNFLKLRFPAVMTGTNVLLSLAVFLLLFVFWYCHKRGRETRLEKEGAEAGLASSASSFNDDGDSIFADKTPARDNAKGEPSKTDEKPEPPLIISDEPGASTPNATVNDLPSVSHLPDPKSGPAKEAGKEEPLPK